MNESQVAPRQQPLPQTQRGLHSWTQKQNPKTKSESTPTNFEGKKSGFIFD